MWLVHPVVGIQVDQQSLADFRQSQGDIRQDSDRLASHFEVDISSIVIELIKEVSQVVLIGEFSQYFNLDVLDIGRLIHFAIEVLEILLEILLAVHVQDDVFDVLQDNVHGLIRSGVLVSAH